MSVFTKPFEEQEKRINLYLKAKDRAIYLHFFERAYESFVSRLTPTGTGNPRMFMRMPEYLFNNGSFGVFERDGELHAWLCGGVGGIDEYGYPNRYILYSANGQNYAGTPVDPKEKIDTKDRVVLDPGDVVIFRANRLACPIFDIVDPILQRMTKTVRAVDNVTGKKGFTGFATPDATAKKAIDEIKTAVEDGESILAIKSPDIGTSVIRNVSMFDGVDLSIADLWESFRHFEGMLWETVGENTVSFEKKERLNVPEVESNDERIAHGIFGIAFDEMQKGIDAVNAKWGKDWKLPEPEPVDEEAAPDDKPDEPGTDPEPKEPKEGDEE